jgi:lipid-A-disaccharide synthase
MTAPSAAPVRIALIAGEASGDHLGAALIDALAARLPHLETFGVGGAEMLARGFRSCFAMSEIAVMGPLTILSRLPQLLARIRETAAYVVDARPDLAVLVDCPEFSHRVARRLRKAMPGLPIIDYVAPSVWAWRPGRARAMRGYVDEVMALLPFEPDVFARLGGPRCRYVGHPAVERPAADIAQIDSLRARAAADGRPLLAVMPGSRMNELKRLCGPFRDALAILAGSARPPAVVMPTLPHLEAGLAREATGWALRPLVVSTGPDRRAAMALADAALVASGTATLELALARTPMVVGYRAEPLFAWMRHIFPIHSIVLANLVHGGSPVPEFYQGRCTGRRLAAAVAPLLVPGPERDAQLRALDEIARKVTGDGTPPSARAAEIVLEALAMSRAAG